MTMPQVGSQTEKIPSGGLGIGVPDLGYHWIWTYGHLIPMAVFSLAALGAYMLAGPSWFVALSAGLACWAAAGFYVMRFVVNMDEVGAMPTPNFTPGKARVLDLGCGAGRTSIIVARENPQTKVSAIDNFSADYITPRQGGEPADSPTGHGEQNTRANFLAAGVSDQIEIESADMRVLPFEDGEFEGVVSSTAIDHLERTDIPVALAEANRVLSDRGQILLWLAVPNVWTSIAFGPLFALHGTETSPADWRSMLGEAGFEIDEEGTDRGLYWVLATRVRAAVETPSEPAVKSSTSRHLHLLVVVAAVVGGILWWMGFESEALLTAGAFMVVTHLGAILLGLGALGAWLVKRHRH